MFGRRFICPSEPAYYIVDFRFVNTLTEQNWLSKTDIFFSHFEGMRGEKTQIFRTCIVDGASLRIEMVEVDGSANFDSGGGRLQLVVVDVEPEAEADSPAAICGCITFDDKSHVKLVKSLSLSTSIVVFW